MKEDFDLDIVMCTHDASSGLIRSINWTYTLTRTLENDKKVYENMDGVSPLKVDPKPDPFVELKDVTKDLCIKWVSDTEDLDSFKLELKKSLDEQSNPTEISSLPWVTSE